MPKLQLIDYSKFVFYLDGPEHLDALWRIAQSQQFDLGVVCQCKTRIRPLSRGVSANAQFTDRDK